MTPEGEIKKKVKKYLDAIAGVYHFWPVQMGYGRKTIDCLMCIDGRFVGIETKRPGEKPTPLQKLTMEKIERSGGDCFVISDENSFQEFKEYMHMIFHVRKDI